MNKETKILVVDDEKFSIEQSSRQYFHVHQQNP